MSLKTSSKSFNRCRMQLPDWLHGLGSVIISLPSSSIFTGYLFLNELNSRFYYLPSKLCISNLQPTFKTLSPATYLLDRFGHTLRSVSILLALTLRPMDLEHSLSQPLKFGTNYLTTYAHYPMTSLPMTNAHFDVFAKTSVSPRSSPLGTFRAEVPMLPGNAKCSMTSVADTKHICRERKIDLWSLEFRSRLRPRARLERDEIIKSLRLELKGMFKRNTVYDLEQSMEVKLENVPGLTSSTKPHSAGWTPWSAILILQQSMMVYSVGVGFGFGFDFRFVFGFWFSSFTVYN